MSSHHSESRSVEQGVDLYRPPQPGGAEEVETLPPESEAPVVRREGEVIPFDPTITAAKTHLERLIERIAEDTETLSARMAGVEPRQAALEAGLTEGLARGAETVTALAEEVAGKLERLAADQERLAEEGVDAVNRAGDAIALLDERVAALEPTPEKLELVAAKLERVNERLGAWTAQLEERVDGLAEEQHALDRRTGRLEKETQGLGGRLDELTEDHRQVKGETGRLLRSTDVLAVLLERLEARFAWRSRVGAAALALLLLALVGVALFGYVRFDDQRVAMSGRIQGVERGVEQTAAAQESRTEAVAQELSGVSAQLTDSVEGLAARHQEVVSELARLEAAMTPRYDPTSNAITVPMHDEDWLLKRDPSHYAVELLVAGNKGELFNYVRYFQSNLDRPVAYTKVEQHGRGWYLLLYGDFATAAEARAALGELPRDMLRYRPRVHLNGELQRMAAS